MDSIKIAKTMEDLVTQVRSVITDLQDTTETPAQVSDDLQYLDELKARISTYIDSSGIAAFNAIKAAADTHEQLTEPLTEVEQIAMLIKAYGGTGESLYQGLMAILRSEDKPT